MGFLDSVFKRNSELESLFDLDLFYDTSTRSYLKKLALETCINFIGRTISVSEFRIIEDKKRIRDDWDYLLNVRPNTDQSAADFWQQFIYRLIYDNEVLVVLSDTNDLLIADSFEREEYAVYPDIFRNVTVKDYTFKRIFHMNEVIYMTYNNEKLSLFMDGIFEDYSDLFTRMIETQKLSNQIRGTVSIDSMQSLDDEQKTKLQKFIDRLFKSFKKNVIALVPKLKGFDYNEVNDGSNNGKSVEELGKLKRDLTDDVANILGIPNSLIHGDMSEYETAIKAYIKFCIRPLIKKIKDELNAKIIEKADYVKGKRIEVYGVAEMDPLEVANAVDKLRASGTYNGNEIRKKLGDEAVDNPILEEYVLTKNYESAATTGKGGETNNE
ncbi:phage portal protein [Paenibacillus alvei]|uniref:Phage portal protein n=1 Tax=Paenibacillus alvei TaxID=44250 RepID=A0ABT4H7C9_PAEAL|nr:phage portal protein [Paenibacillus alvei]EJW14227.1 phage portal protein, HK97 family [Paenibacillus alvei DSM 29]MCY9544920.1 phage portal protein [Paenibacillus alvei]MCY9708751.1 phage portal protein [Paenibacillus alvei]MCY9737967.1 phage portal protein [Paenibacillus alvei]MCY9758927.1 phage portal protein [Paenibacillus alvei]